MNKFFVKYKFYLLFLMPLAIFWAFGFYHLDKFETADEHYWTNDPAPGRIAKYWWAIGGKKWAGTFINDKPGVTLAYVSGVALKWVGDSREQIFENHGAYQIYNSEVARRVNFLFRLPLLVFNGLFVLLLAWLVFSITGNRWIAFWSATFIFLSPPLIGISQIINPDALLWSFASGTILAWTAFLEKGENRFSILTGVLLGFSLLTKYTSIILIPFLFVEMLAYLWIYPDKNLNERLFKALKNYWIVIFFGGALFSLFFPAVIFKPKLFFKSILDLGGAIEMLILLIFFSLFLVLDVFWKKSRGLDWIFKKTEMVKKYFPSMLAGILLVGIWIVLINWMGNSGFMSGIRKVPFDEGEGTVFERLDFYEKIILEFLPIVFSLTPLALGLWIFSLGSLIFGKGRDNFLKLMLLFFIAVFFLAVAFQELFITVRYGIILYPLISILAAMAIWDLSSWGVMKSVPKIVLTAGIILIGTFSIWSIKPFYFNYTNFLLNNKKMIADAWGYGGWEAGEYINNLPDTENLFVWTDYNGYCPFLKVKCIKGNKDLRRAAEKEVGHIDYFLKTRRGSILYSGVWNQIEWEFLAENAKPVWRLEIEKGRPGNYVEIYKAKD